MKVNAVTASINGKKYWQNELTRRCCRTNFPQRSKFAAERGVITFLGISLEHWTCHFCTEINAADKKTCWKCRERREESAESGNQQLTSDSKYPALRAVSNLLNLAAVLILILSVIGAIVFILQIGGLPGIGSAVVSAIFGVLQWLFLRAAAESMVVLIDIEKNTRLAAERPSSEI